MTIGYDIYPSVGGPAVTFGAKKYKDVVFYKQRVIRHQDAVTYRALAKLGAYTRSIMKNLLTPSPEGRPSRRGHPPNIHPPSQLKQNILWDHVRGGDAVVIGPRLLHGSGVGYEPWGDVTVPQLLEEGGVVTDEGEEVRYYKRPYSSRALKLATRPRYLGRFWRQALNEVSIV